MFFLPSSIFFFFFLMFSLAMASISSNWISIWMSMEMNMVVFLPLISSDTGGFQIENSMKYYLIQSVGSSWFLFSLMIFSKGEMMMLFILLTMLLKLGLSPFHLWFFSIFTTSSWKLIFILSTIQKYIPLMVVSHITMSKNVLVLILILSLMIVMTSGMPQLLPRKIMALSSLNNVSWMLLASFSSSYIWVFYLTIYSFLLVPVIYIFDSLSNQMKTQMMLNSMTNNSKFFLVFSFMSLSGLPPLLGFFNKILMVKILVAELNMLLLLLIIFSSLLLMFYYLNMIYIMTCLTSPSLMVKSTMNNSFLKFNLVFSMVLIVYMFSCVI